MTRSFGPKLTSAVESDMLWVEMLDGEEHKAPAEILDELDVLRELDADDVVAEAIVGEATVAEDRAAAAGRRRVWLGLRLALLVAIGVVLIVAALFRYQLPPDDLLTGIASESTEPVVAPEPDPDYVRQISERVSQVSRWRHETEVSLKRPRVGPDGTVYAFNTFMYGDRQVCFAFAPDGDLRWRRDNPRSQFSWLDPLPAPGGGVYLADRAGQVVALDAEGHTCWTAELAGSIAGVATDPEGEVVYAAGNVTREGSCRVMLYALDQAGNDIWQRELAGRLTTCTTYWRFGPREWPVLTAGPDDTLYVVSATEGYGEPNALAAVRSDGSLAWQQILPDEYTRESSMYIGSRKYEPPDQDMDVDLSEYPSGVIEERVTAYDLDDRFRAVVPAPGGLCIAVTKTDVSHSGKLLAYGPEGDLLWSAALDVFDYTTPVVDGDGTVYVCCAPLEGGERQYQLRAIEPREGTTIWSCPIEAGGELALGPDGSLYVSRIESLCAVGADGMVRWCAKEGGYRSPPYVSTDGLVYVSREYGLAAYRADGREEFSLELGEHGARSVALGPDGAAYVVVGDGELIALRSRE